MNIDKQECANWLDKCCKSIIEFCKDDQDIALMVDEFSYDLKSNMPCRIKNRADLIYHFSHPSTLWAYGKHEQDICQFCLDYILNYETNHSKYVITEKRTNNMYITIGFF